MEEKSRELADELDRAREQLSGNQAEKFYINKIKELEARLSQEKEKVSHKESEIENAAIEAQKNKQMLQENEKSLMHDKQRQE